MNPLSNLFSGPENIFWFVAGILSVQAWQWIKCKWKDRVDPGGAPHRMKRLNWFYIWTSLVLVSVALVGVQNARTYTYAEQLAKDTQACQTEFNQALRARGQINAENDRWSLIQRTALADWIHSLIFPPPDIAALPPESGTRQQWILEQTAKADQIIRQAQDEQDRNIRERPAYPDPECGKK